MFFLQACVGSLGLLFLYVLFILVVLKEDGYSSVAIWSWRDVVMAPAIASALMFIVFFCLQYFWSIRSTSIFDGENSRRKSSDQRKRLLSETDWNRSQDAISASLHSVELSQLNTYHESVTFSSVLLILAYLIYLVFIAFALLTPCSRCQTPYHAISIGLCITYGIRIITEIIAATFTYYSLRLLIYELDLMQKSRNDYRFFYRVLPDLTTPFWIHWMHYISAFMFVCSIVGALCVIFWTTNHDCEATCPRRFEAYFFLTIAIFLLEGLYLLSLLLFVYLRRVLSVEAVLAAVAAFTARPTLSPKAADEGGEDEE